jgi:hypothetical protein
VIKNFNGKKFKRLECSTVIVLKLLFPFGNQIDKEQST